MVGLNELSSSPPQGTLGQVIYSFMSIRVRFPLPSIQLAKCTQICHAYHPLFVNSFLKDYINDSV